jgi:DNA processing protein
VSDARSGASGGKSPGPVEADREELGALLRLQRLPKVGDARLQPLLDRFGSAREAWAAPRQPFELVAGPEAAGRRSDAELARRVDEGLAWCEAHGVEVVSRWSADYPSSLAGIDNPPGVLFFKGDRSLLEREVVTVVGTRAATEYGRRVAHDVANIAARHGAVVASGLALGIDGVAHRAALEAGGKTMAVLGAGVNRPHPRSHTQLFRQIAREGLLVSEFLPAEPPLRHHFLQRNRTLAAIATVVVVVEAAEKSGALNTARHANDLCKTVISVPGSIYSRTSAGTNALLEEAYALVTPATVLEHLSCGAEPQLALAAAPPGDIGADARRVWDALDEAPSHVDEVARRARLSAGAALASLAQLEVAGWARQEAGARFARSVGP